MIEMLQGEAETIEGRVATLQTPLFRREFSSKDFRTKDSRGVHLAFVRKFTVRSRRVSIFEGLGEP